MPVPSIIPAPTGRGDDKRALFSAAKPFALQITVPVESGEPDLINIPAPKGSHELFVQNRMCGDWYAEFTAGKLMSCAIGVDRVEAIRNAAAAMVLS